MGLYAAVGTQYAVDFGVSAIGAVLVGTAASVTGGILVAILRHQTPTILVSGPPYAVLSIGGSTIYVLLHSINGGLAALACVVFVVVMRVVTLKLGIKTPHAARV